ncbi:hypothetical protein ES703_121125 [subsurface metagenome]
MTKLQDFAKLEDTLQGIRESKQRVIASKSLVGKRGVETISPEDKANIQLATNILKKYLDPSEGIPTISEEDRPIFESALKTLGLSVTLEEIIEEPNLLTQALEGYASILSGGVSNIAVKKIKSLIPPEPTSFLIKNIQSLKGDYSGLSSEQISKLLGL